MAVERTLTDIATLAETLRGARLVDLTQTLEEGYPAHGMWLPPFKHVVYNWYEPRPNDAQRVLSRSYRQVSADGRETVGTYYGAWMTIYEHTGTHFDAPVHAIPPSKSGLPHANEWGDVYGDMVPLHKFQGPLAVIDTRFLREGPQRNGISPLLQLDHVKEWEAAHGELQAGDVVALLTGWDEYYVPYPEGEAYLTKPFGGQAPGWPAPTEEVVIYLHDKGIETLVSDVPSLGATDDIQSVHWAGLGRGMVFIENVTRLQDLPPRGSYFIFLAPKITRSSGCFGRAMAWVVEEDE
jgi:kynurenine formamidase